MDSRASQMVSTTSSVSFSTSSFQKRRTRKPCDSSQAVRLLSCSTCSACWPAVHLDQQTSLQAREIHNVGTQRNLAPEPIPRQLVGAQAPPELSFRVRLVSPKPSCTLACHSCPPLPNPP